MSVRTQGQIAEQMVAQIRLLQPSISAEVGTPERLVLDTVSDALSESSIDLIGLQNALNIDSKFGSNLTNFLALFGFSRSQATKATGFIVFSRNAPANVDILVPGGTIIKANVAQDGILPEFATTAAITLPAGQTQTSLCPIESVRAGSSGNVATNTITVMGLAPVLGITSVTNPTATVNGADQEDDNSLKVRFKNTVFRNLSGTKDQFLALAISTAFSTKANVIGPISKYQEYVQVVEKDDSESVEYEPLEPGVANYPGTPAPFVVKGSSSGAVLTVPSTAGMLAGEKVKIWYSALGHPKLVEFEGATKETTIESVKSSTELKLAKKPISPVVNAVCLIGTLSTASHVNQWTTALSDIPYAKDIWTGLPVFVSNNISGISKYFFREGVDFTFNFPGLLQGDALRDFIDGTGIDPRSDPLGVTQPNVTFTNVYRGAVEAVKAISPEDVVLLEYSYTSTSSRNSLAHNVTNAVDVYVDGSNEQPTTTLFTAPLASPSQGFVDVPTSMYYYENYRRDGEPAKRPIEGNILTPLFSQPILNLPAQITIGTSKYYLGTHYWLVHDVSLYGGTIRARDGIEWSNTIGGDKGGVGEGPPTTLEPEPEYTGAKFGELHNPTLVEVENYFYDQNIEDLQAALEGARQITTDTLAHRAKTRYFKLDISVIYSPQATPSTVNTNISEALAQFLANQYFGNVIRLSDLLQVIHNVAGVENVRWSNDVPNNQNLVRIYETDNHGTPLRGVYFDRIQWGATAKKEIQSIYIVGQPTSGVLKFKYFTAEATIANVATVTAAELETAINTALEGKTTVTVAEDVRSTVGVINPIRSFRATFAATAKQPLPTVNNSLIEGGGYTFDTDFFLRDDELPALPANAQVGDTVPGLIIRPRAQNVWQKT